jgi:SAM-dependent methyltransferase
MSILDLGCGTGEFLSFVPGCRYVGIDLHDKYIKRAQKMFGGLSTFIVGSAEEAPVLCHERFHIVVCFGLLHHLDDSAVLKTLDGARTLLEPGGRLVTIDPCYVEGQAKFAKFLIGRDRGEFVRDMLGYVDLCSTVFGGDVRHEIRHDLLRIPYSHCILECEVGP